jgi:hypothetical protein
LPVPRTTEDRWGVSPTPNRSPDPTGDGSGGKAAENETMIPLSALPAIWAGMHQCAATPPSTPPRERQPKQLYHQKRGALGPKDKEWTNILYDVRVHMNSFLKIKQDLDLLQSEAAFEDQEMVKAFEDGESDDGPVLDPMRPAWKVLNCRWNKRLAEMFVDYMVQEVGRDEGQREDLTWAFTERLTRLRTMLVTKKRRENETQKAWLERVEKEVRQDGVRKRGNARRATVST